MNTKNTNRFEGKIPGLRGWVEWRHFEEWLTALTQKYDIHFTFVFSPFSRLFFGRIMIHNDKTIYEKLFVFSTFMTFGTSVSVIVFPWLVFAPLDLVLRANDATETAAVFALLCAFLIFAVGIGAYAPQKKLKMKWFGVVFFVSTIILAVIALLKLAYFLIFLSIKVPVFVM